VGLDKLFAEFSIDTTEVKSAALTNVTTRLLRKLRCAWMPFNSAVTNVTAKLFYRSINSSLILIRAKFNRALDVIKVPRRHGDNLPAGD
jgi:hypothetical protein